MQPDHFRELTRAFPEAYLLLDASGRLLAYNDRAQHALALREAALGEPLATFVADGPATLASFLRICARSSSLVPGRLHWKGADAQARPFRVEGAVIRSSSNPEPLLMMRFRAHAEASEQFVALNRRITDLGREILQRRQAEALLKEQARQLEELTAELEQTVDDLAQQRTHALEARDAAEAASRAKSNFVAVISHELRTPLNAIIGYADLLDAGIGGTLTNAQKEHLTRMRRSAHHLLLLIEQVLTFSRIEAGKERLHQDIVDPVQLSREAVEMVEATARQRNLEIRMESIGAIRTLRSDAEKLRQILLNLLSNAIKYTEHGEIRLEIANRDGILSFAIHDTGIGIDEQDLERIFHPFTQLDSTRTRRAGGTGLGLTVSRKLARLIGGDIRVRSAPGQGSTFELALPLRRSEDVTGS